MGTSDAIGAKLQVNMSAGTKGVVVKAGANTLGSSFNYTGAPQTYQVPLGVKQVTITAYGAQGGGGSWGPSGGLGGSAVATITVTPLEILNVFVGGSDGGSSSGGGGSGYLTGTYTSMANGVQSGNGRVIITPTDKNLIEWQDVSGTVLGVVKANGSVGIGTAILSAYLDIAAGKSTIADAWSTRSSLRFKENLYPIDNALNKLSSLQGVYFDYKDSHKHSLGLVAEDVGKVFPELVTYETNGQDAISLDYDKLNAVTIEAIKEQQKEIEELKAILKETSRNQQKK